MVVFSHLGHELQMSLLAPSDFLLVVNVEEHSRCIKRANQGSFRVKGFFSCLHEGLLLFDGRGSGILLHDGVGVDASFSRKLTLLPITLLGLVTRLTLAIDGLVALKLGDSLRRL